MDVYLDMCEELEINLELDLASYEVNVCGK